MLDFRSLDAYIVDTDTPGWPELPQYLDPAPRLIESGAAAGNYLVVARLQDYPQTFKNWLDANAERATEIGVDVIFPEWIPGETVDPGDCRAYNGDLWACVQGHTTQADWTPPVVPALWMRETPEGEIPLWTDRAPTLSQFPFMKYERCEHNSTIWESKVDNNVWMPDPNNQTLWVQV